MRIADFFLEGFGCLTDLSLTDVPPGLSVILGDNEAGKTTLLAFLRSVLFGLPSRKQNEFYPPVSNRRKGGRIVLLDKQSQRITVERFEGRGIGPLTVTFPDGSQGGEEEFRQLIGAATADLYRNVFAFGLSELQTLDSLATDKVRDAIYSAGIGIGRRTISEVVQELRSQSGELFMRRGRTQILNHSLGKIEELRSQIRGHEEDLDRYERIHAELEAVQTAIVRIDAELAADRRRFERIRILQQAWDDWIALGAYREEAKALPLMEGFPENGVQRIDNLGAERRSLNDRKEAEAAQKAEAAVRLAKIEVDAALLSAAGDVRQIERGLPLYEQGLGQRPALDTEKEMAGQRLAVLLGDLGEEWDERKLAGFDLSVPVREEIDGSRRALENARRDSHQRKLEWDQQARQLEEAIGREDDAGNVLEQLPQTPETLDADGIRKLVLHRKSYEDARRDLPGVEKECEVRLGYLRDALRNFGPQWNEERLVGFDTSLTVQEVISSHQRRLADALSGQREASRRLGETLRAVEDAEAELARAEEAFSALPEAGTVAEAVLLRRKNSLRDLQSLLGDAQRAGDKLESLGERKRDLDAQIGRRERDHSSGSASMPAWRRWPCSEWD